MEFKYDVIVIGAGHAGCEAAAAAANLGSKTCLITMDMNKIGQMSCNPAVGGIAKGQIVREIDALGGYMGLVTDQTAIQFRILNRSKGPAMWSPRAQCDRNKFIWAWREILENIPNLHIWQDTVQEILVENGEITRSLLEAGGFPLAQAPRPAAAGARYSPHISSESPRPRAPHEKALGARGQTVQDPHSRSAAASKDQRALQSP